MSENIQESEYVITKSDGSIELQPDAHISIENIDDMIFTFAEGQDITESVAKKNAKNKTPVSYTKNGRTAYAPVTVTYPDGVSESHNFLLEGCIVQYTIALTAQNHSYARDFVFIGIPESYIDKIIKDARDRSQMNLTVKSNVQLLNGFYWLRCNLDKLSHKNTRICTADGEVKMSIDAILKEMKKNVLASIVFSLSASMNNNSMNEELDLKDGTYTITMKPVELYAYDETSIDGPTLQDTNSRKKEGSAMADTFIAKGGLAELAAKRLRGNRGTKAS